VCPLRSPGNRYRLSITNGGRRIALIMDGLIQVHRGPVRPKRPIGEATRTVPHRSAVHGTPTARRMILDLEESKAPAGLAT